MANTGRPDGESQWGGEEWSDMEAQLEKKCLGVTSAKRRTFHVPTQLQNNLLYIYISFFFAGSDFNGISRNEHETQDERRGHRVCIALSQFLANI